MVDSMLARANGDSTLAMILFAEDMILLSDDIIYLERDLSAANGYAENLETRMKLAEPPWWEKLWDSDITKVVLFMGGVWTGKALVEVR